MAQQLINIGSSPNDGTGDNVRVGGAKINENFTDLYTNKGGFKYTSIRISAYNIQESELIHGHNIYGVNHANPVAITLPKSIDSNKIITIKDESGIALLNNITITIV